MIFSNGQTFFHFATNTQLNSKSTFWFSFKNASTSLMTLGLLAKVIIPYSIIPVYVNMILSQNGAITTANDRGNNVGEELVNDVPKLSRPFEFIYIK